MMHRSHLERPNVTRSDDFESRRIKALFSNIAAADKLCASFRYIDMAPFRYSVYTIARDF